MNTFVQTLTNTTQTLNCALSNKSSLDPIVDLFSMGVSSTDKRELIKNALLTDPVLTTKVVFYLRDVRAGQGNRDIMRAYHSIMNELITYTEFHDKYKQLLPFLPDIGSWKDVYELYNNTYSGPLKSQILLLVHIALKAGDVLCAKWFPRQKDFHKDFALVYFNGSMKEVRKLVVSLTKVVETQMCNNQWSTINYDHVPTRANLIYKNAFMRHDLERRTAYLSSDSTSIKSSVAYPHEIAHMAKNDDYKTADAMWKNLPDYMANSESFNILPIIDTSGSMTSTAYSKYSCMDIAIGLGLYFSEHNKGTYKDVWCNFSNKPTFMKLSGPNLSSRIANLDYTNWDYSTNLQAVFDTILDVYTKTKNAEELPKAVIIVSDMEFNYCGPSNTNFEAIKAKYAKHSLVPPILIFWRVDVKSTQQPVTIHDSGSILINGYSPSIMQLILSMNLEELRDINSKSMMLKAVANKYSFIDEIFGETK